jgi:hypothetical protein
LHSRCSAVSGRGQRMIEDRAAGKWEASRQADRSAQDFEPRPVLDSGPYFIRGPGRRVAIQRKSQTGSITERERWVQAGKIGRSIRRLPGEGNEVNACQERLEILRGHRPIIPIKARQNLTPVDRTKSGPHSFILIQGLEQRANALPSWFFENESQNGRRIQHNAIHARPSCRGVRARIAPGLLLHDARQGIRPVFLLECRAV